ncbi:hypothetical protein H2200_007748 [Cladophialophora chaetospira]|uniref:Zn(2)-C6 fungal-type domain-containing protein n=1 Tax=Cladophialophora chaetospira TaxID=386627 RepID=A0AA38X6C5_9EURO|nr:hypothetical protein H2200_007748 [Cladophialophora chaetospira]
MADPRLRKGPLGSVTAQVPELSQRSKIGIACLGCKIRRSKCSGGQPCNNCSRLEIECVYDASQDKRRKIHWERAETESTLQKELLQRLFDLIRAGDGEVHRLLIKDSHSRELAQRLGLEVPEYVEQLQTQTWPYARTTSHGEVEDDVSQREELEKRQSNRRPAEEGGAMELDPPTARTSRTGSTEHSIVPTFSEMLMPSPGTSDARDQYRIFCSSDHRVPSIESISVFGEIRLAPTKVTTSYGSITLQQQQTVNLRIPEYLIQPLLFDEERCPMAAVYTDFRDYGRRQLAEGQSLETVLGSSKVDLALYFRERRPGDPHTPATWACEFMRLLKDFDTYVALACIFTYARFMRVSPRLAKWVIAPSEDTFALLPEAMKPTAVQKLVRHHPGVDLPIFPEMRDGLILDMRDYIVAIQTLGCSVNWEKTLDEAVDVDSEKKVLTVSDEFANHICDLSNWSVSQSFADVFPELRGLYRVAEQETIPVSETDVEGFLQRQGIKSAESEIAAGA